MLRRIFTIIAILAGIGVIVLTQTMLRDHIQGIITERTNNANERDKQKARALKDETILATTSNNLLRTQGTLASTTSDLEKTKGELTSLSGAHERTVADLKKSQDEEKAALQRLEQWRALGITPEGVKEMADNFEKSKQTLAVAQDEFKILARAYAKATNTIAGFTSEKEYEAPLPMGLKGTVVAVDPKWDFVVLNIGDTKGVLKDGVMKVHRDSKLVGKIKITNVMSDRSIANVVSGWKLDEIREGDEVLY